MAGGDEDNCVYEAAGTGVIVAGLEVIEGGFGVVNIAAVAQGVGFAGGCCHGARGCADKPPFVLSLQATPFPCHSEGATVGIRFLWMHQLP